MRFDIGCRMQFYGEIEVPVILMLRPQSSSRQAILQESYDLKPFTPITEYKDSYGNLCQRLILPQGDCNLEVMAQAEILCSTDLDPTAPFIPIVELPASVLQFLLPSRYCESDRLYQLATEITADIEPGYPQVEAICQWIYDNIKFEYGTSNASTSALNIVEGRQGVCRDFAHLGIALCRSLSIPARMVVGYLHQLKPMDLHAWFEAYIGHRWDTFDATQVGRSTDRIVIAYGRDATDVALITQFGPLQLNQMQVWINAVE
jgi:transglutaminase-like putative cysteine protease